MTAPRAPAAPVAAEPSVEPPAPTPESPAVDLAPLSRPIGALPDSYGDGQIVVMPRSADSAYVYWDVSPGTSRRLEPEALLRTVIAGDPPRPEDRIEIAVSPIAGSCSLENLPAGARVRVSLGTRRDARFVEALRSREVRLPRDGTTATGPPPRRVAKPPARATVPAASPSVPPVRLKLLPSTPAERPGIGHDVLAPPRATVTSRVR
ncbi:MAG: DUF4912 domain-containing protein [Acidobacteriota bacterium]